jgi:hypothetical protein
MSTALAQLSRLEGFDAPTKISPTNPAGDGPAEMTLTVTDEDRAKALAAFFAQVKAKGRE